MSIYQSVKHSDLTNYGPDEEDSEGVPTVPALDPTKLTRANFYFGKTLGEGSYARVVHAKMKNNENSPEFAIKIMEKGFIQKEKKVMKDFNIISCCPLISLP
jgi:hypothetical protein